MNVGLVGLGKMGNAIAHRLLKSQHKVFGYDIDDTARKQARSVGVSVVESLDQLPQKASIIWLMVPAGTLVDSVIQDLLPHLKKNEHIIIDGGNSKFTDSIRRAETLSQHSIVFLDCGISGGLRGQELGFSLMIGGQKQAYTKA